MTIATLICWRMSPVVTSRPFASRRVRQLPILCAALKRKCLHGTYEPL
jgi:hypothetical protein